MNIKIEKIINLLKDLKEQIRKDYKAEIVGVFGSYVRGEAHKGSDFDVLAKFERGADLFHFVGLSFFLEEKIGVKVDIVPYDAIRKEIKEYVLKEAIYL